MAPYNGVFLLEKFFMKSKEILSVIDKYINQYKAEENPKYETKYRIPSSDVSMLGPDFIRDDKSRVFFCFYRLSPEQYDNGEAQSFADAFFINGDSLKDGKIKLELNINMPVRVEGNEVFVDRSMMAELITHELTHAYRKSKELAAGHYKSEFSLLDFITRRKKANKKYNMNERTKAYIRTMPNPNSDSNIYEKMKWVGYTLVEDEMFANISGAEAFFASGGKIKDSRGKQQVDIIKKYLDFIEKNATPEDWKKCMNEISYISARKNETPDRFGKRWVSYYRDRISKFYEKLDRLKDKYSNNTKTDKFKVGFYKLAQSNNKKMIGRERD